LYTAIIYKGPQIISKIKLDLTNSLKTDGYKNVKEAIGREV